MSLDLASSAGRLTGFCTASRNSQDGAFRFPAVSGVIMREFMAITKALADEQRVRMLLALRRHELCVCQIVSLVGLATSTVSKHMSILKQARLVESRKEGRWIYYRLPSDDLPPMVQQAMDWMFEHLAEDPRIERDQQRLEAICSVDPQQLCSSKNGQQDCRRKAKTGRTASRS